MEDTSGPGPGAISLSGRSEALQRNENPFYPGRLPQDAGELSGGEPLPSAPAKQGHRDKRPAPHGKLCLLHTGAFGPRGRGGVPAAPGLGFAAAPLVDHICMMNKHGLG